MTKKEFEKEMAKIYSMKVDATTKMEIINKMVMVFNESQGFEYPTNKCCICGKKFKGFGNNAQPVKDGICCDDCNNYVIAVRMKSPSMVER